VYFAVPAAASILTSPEEIGFVSGVAERKILQIL
jgi:hypothetical protein